MPNHIKLDVREFYNITRLSLEKVADIECEQTEGLFRCVSALRRLIRLGQKTIEISTGRWNCIAASIECEADKEGARQVAYGRNLNQIYDHHTAYLQ
jgi:hypothetical protein